MYAGVVICDCLLMSRVSSVVCHTYIYYLFLLIVMVNKDDKYYRKSSSRRNTFTISNKIRHLLSVYHIIALTALRCKICVSLVHFNHIPGSYSLIFNSKRNRSNANFYKVHYFIWLPATDYHSNTKTKH